MSDLAAAPGDPVGEDGAVVDRLFVYGTLAPGRPNAHVLGDVAGTWEQGWVCGRLVEHGWGAALGYPALEIGSAGRVDGWVLTSEELATTWGRLDHFEGDGYQRVVTTAGLADGAHVPVHVYVARGQRPSVTTR